MKKYRKLTNSFFTVIATVTIVLFFPAASWADSSSTCQPPKTTQPGVHWPTGSDAGTFTYQCSGPYTGEWTNQYYVFDPATTVRTPLYSPDYSYDCNSGLWYMTEYDFDAATGQYIANRVVTSSPGLPTNCPITTAPTNNGSPNNVSGDSTANPNNGSGIQNTGPGSTNTSDNNLNNNLGVNNTNNLTVGNNLTATASSGNAIVTANTSAGDATSGNVQNEQNIINMLQSSSNVLGSGQP